MAWLGASGLGVSQETADKMSAGASVTWRLDWAGEPAPMLLCVAGAGGLGFLPQGPPRKPAQDVANDQRDRDRDLNANPKSLNCISRNTGSH